LDPALWRHAAGSPPAGAVVVVVAAGSFVPAVVDPVSEDVELLDDGEALGVSCWLIVPKSGGAAEESDDPAAAGTATATRLVESRAANASLGRTTQITSAWRGGYAQRCASDGCPICRVYR
jgi:hypothetical protein